MLSPAQRLHFAIDAAPLVVITLHDGWSSSDLKWMFERFDELFARRERYVLLFDTGPAHNPPNATERKLISDWTKRTESEVTRFSLGCAVVFKSALIRGSLTALNWVMPQARPLVYVPSAAEGAAWCVERLREAGIGLPMESRGYLLRRGITHG